MRPHRRNFVGKVCSTLPPVAAIGGIDTDAPSWGHVNRGMGANAATLGVPEIYSLASCDFVAAGWGATFDGEHGFARRPDLTTGVGSPRWPRRRAGPDQVELADAHDEALDVSRADGGASRACVYRLNYPVRASRLVAASRAKPQWQVTVPNPGSNHRVPTMTSICSTTLPPSHPTSSPPTVSSPHLQPPLEDLELTPDANEPPYEGSAAPCPIELAKMWSIFEVDGGSLISLRAISPKDAPVELLTRNLTFTPADFPDVEDRKQAFSEYAITLNTQGYNVYIVMNPINLGFRGNLSNRIAVADPDIISRRLLLIDLDRTGHLVASATDEEINDSAEVADLVAAFLEQEYDVEVVRVMSGNGSHLYMALQDIPNDARFKTACQQLLVALGQKFDTPTIKIDRGVFNASRITKVPGTVARKGVETSDRPFRMAFVA